MAVLSVPMDQNTVGYRIRCANLIALLASENNPLPWELTEPILCEAGYLPVRVRKTNEVATDQLPHPASIPPQSGASPFMDKVPSDVRRMILTASLPSRDTEFKPLCADSNKVKVNGMKPRHNEVSDLMVLNKVIKNEVARVVYEERFFAVHVHQGVKHGGIEVINVGRQPLQYKTENDMRFDRFTGIEEFGFHRLKKLHITIFHEATNEANHRHIALNTYFMNHAICLLLKRDSMDALDNQRITNIIIDFDSESDKPSEPVDGWIDRNTQSPRITSIHGISDIELVLRPFALLTGVHNVKITLPETLNTHEPTASFALKLEKSMMSMTGGMFNTDDLDHKIETAKEALHDYVIKQLYGGVSSGSGHDGVDRIPAEEFMEDMQGQDHGADDFDDSFDGNSEYEQEDAGDDPRDHDYAGWLNKMTEEETAHKEDMKQAEMIAKRAEAEQKIVDALELLGDRQDEVSSVQKKEDELKIIELLDIAEETPFNDDTLWFRVRHVKVFGKSMKKANVPVPSPATIQSYAARVPPKLRVNKPLAKPKRERQLDTLRANRCRHRDETVARSAAKKKAKLSESEDIFPMGEEPEGKSPCPKSFKDVKFANAGPADQHQNRPPHFPELAALETALSALPKTRPTAMAQANLSPPQSALSFLRFDAPLSFGLPRDGDDVFSVPGSRAFTSPSINKTQDGGGGISLPSTLSKRAVMDMDTDTDTYDCTDMKDGSAFSPDARDTAVYETLWWARRHRGNDFSSFVAEADFDTFECEEVGGDDVFAEP